MYATGEGGYAKDGLDGSEHGVFTDALLKVLDQPGLNLVDMCAEVQKEVESVTGGEQKPDFQAGGGMMEIRELSKISLVAKAVAPEPAPASGMAVPAGMEKWDTNGDGYLDAAELQAMNASAGLGAPPASASPRPAAAIKTLADFVAACDDVDSMDDLLADYSSREEFAALLEAYDGLLKDKTKPPGQKQREKLLSEHCLHLNATTEEKEAAEALHNAELEPEPESDPELELSTSEPEPEYSGLAHVQYSGKGDFQKVWLSLATPGELALKTQKADVTVLRSFNVQGCSLAEPKSARKGHENALRVDTSKDDVKGDKKYIISVATGDELSKLRDALGKGKSAGKKSGRQ
jgi:hypothetical protein